MLLLRTTAVGQREHPPDIYPKQRMPKAVSTFGLERTSWSGGPHEVGTWGGSGFPRP